MEQYRYRIDYKTTLGTDTEFLDSVYGIENPTRNEIVADVLGGISDQIRDNRGWNGIDDVVVDYDNETITCFDENGETVEEYWAFRVFTWNATDGEWEVL